MLCIAGPDGYFKRVNPAFEKTLGWNQEELLSRPFLDFVHPEDRDETLRQMENLARGLPTVSFENRYEVAQGGHRILQWTAHPDQDTNLIYAIAQDVTEERAERNQAKEEILRLRTRLNAVMREDANGEGDPS
jgi:PAS domain S-box-containing protein